MTLYPRSRFLRNTIFLFCFVLMLIALDMLWAQSRRTIHPRYDTTRIVEPTMSDGSIDYLAAIENYFSRGVTPENNAVPLLFEALGRVALPKSQPPDGITSRLGMPHLPEQGDYFVTYEEFTKKKTGKAQSLENDQDARTAPRGKLEKPTPMIRDWLATNEKPLAKIREASLRTRYFIPFNGGNRPDMIVSVLLPHVKPLGDVSNALSLRSRIRVEAGDVSGAGEDALTLHRLSRVVGQAPTLVERLVGIVAETLACDADRSLAESGKMSAQDLRDLSAKLAGLPDLQPPSAAIDQGERYMMLDASQRFARLSPMEAGRLYRAVSGSGDMPPEFLFPFLPIPYEQSMIDANAWYDGLLTAFRQPTYTLRHDALVRWEKGVKQVSADIHFGIVSADWALRLFMPALNRFQARWETARAELGLTRIALLLAAYKQEHNAYPGSLAELEADQKIPLPPDNFTDHSFYYTRTPTGYTLSSPGPNLADDAGGIDDLVVTRK
jgi:hypothetical protein